MNVVEQGLYGTLQGSVVAVIVYR